MPFKSTAQRRFMHSQHPEIANRWEKEYPNQGKLPEHVKSGIKHDHTVRELHRHLTRGDKK